MRTNRFIVGAVIFTTLLIAKPFQGQESSDKSAATHEEVEQLRKEVASQRETIEALKSAVDQLVKASAGKTIETPTRPAGPVAVDKANTANASAPPSTGAAPSRPTVIASATHGFFERKAGDRMTFYTPGGELTTYGNFDVSVDATTKGLGGFLGPDGNPPVGNMGWMPALSTNLSYIGVRGFQAVKGMPFDFVYQFETQIDIVSTSGTAETNSNQSNVVKGGLTSRNTYLGVANPRWGSLLLGKTDPPYKNSTARLNPFFAMIGDYQVIMANTGGDNRVEFGTRLDHSIWYESPNWNGVVIDALVSPGQNRADNSDNIAAGESDCTGGNIPGSGGITPLTCSDGSFGLATSVSASYTKNAFYLAGAYERHENVNRSSDITASYASGNAYSQMLALQDVAAEDAGKIAALYTFSSRTTIGGIFETLHRYVPADLEFQNERQRLGMWFVASQQLSHNTSLHFGWAHAFRTPGDPGQHNDSNEVPPGGDPATDATAGAHADNTANMFTVAFKNQLSKKLTAYVDWALTANGPAAHYDLGAGGRSVTTDCHDAFAATGGLVGSNPHCWTGGTLQGVSAGLNWKF